MAGLRVPATRHTPHAAEPRFRFQCPSVCTPLMQAGRTKHLQERSQVPTGHVLLWAPSLSIDVRAVPYALPPDLQRSGLTMARYRYVGSWNEYSSLTSHGESLILNTSRSVNAVSAYATPSPHQTVERWRHGPSRVPSSTPAAFCSIRPLRRVRSHLWSDHGPCGARAGRPCGCA